jgi:hypothetical protein
MDSIAEFRNEALLMDKNTQSMIENLFMKRKIFNISTTTQAYVSVGVSIKPAYLKYIETYGIPDDGIFIPELLNQFIC